MGLDPTAAPHIDRPRGPILVFDRLSPLDRDVLRRAVTDVTTLIFVGGLALSSVYSGLSNSSARDLPSVLNGLIRLPGVRSSRPPSCAD